MAKSLAPISVLRTKSSNEEKSKGESTEENCRNLGKAESLDQGSSALQHGTQKETEQKKESYAISVTYPSQRWSIGPRIPVTLLLH